MSDGSPARLWTPVDNEMLRALVLDRMHTQSIAIRMERTPTEIRKQASRLNILLRPGDPQRQMGG
jgi:hypothetical protein